MFSLPQTVGYAIRALSCLEESPQQRRTAREIATCTAIPPSYLSKILRALVQAGLIDGLRGHAGGFHLAQPPRSIRLSQIIKAIDPKLRVHPCFLGVAPCEGDEPCPLHRFWKPQRARIEKKLESTTLADVTRFYRQQIKSCCTPQKNKKDMARPSRLAVESHAGR